jgi:pyridoxamine 5'-phosphate oxidase
MNIQDCIKFTNENPICYLATADADQPRVRALGFWFADESGFYFQTSGIKEFVNQLRINPKSEVCFYKPDTMAGILLRITGKVEFVDSPALRKRVFIDRPFMKGFGLTIDSLGLVLFRIGHSHAYFWTMGNNMNPKELIEF